MFVVDTNLLLYAANEHSPHQKRMHVLLGEWGANPEGWFITWSVVYEFLRVATHHSVFAHALTFSDAWSFIESLRLSPPSESWWKRSGTPR